MRFIVAYYDPTLPLYHWRCHKCSTKSVECATHCRRCSHRNCDSCMLRNMPKKGGDMVLTDDGELVMAKIQLVPQSSG